MKLKQISLIKTEKKELLIFLLIAFGLPFLMGIPLAILSNEGKNTFSFASAQMFYPTAGLIIAKLICDKDKSLMPKNFFIGFLVLTSIMILWCFALFFLPDQTVVKGSTYLSIAGTIIVGILLLGENGQKRRGYGLISKNWNLSIFLLVLFVILYFVRVLLFNIATGDLRKLFDSISISYLSMIFVELPLGFFLSFSLFLGEEYGWRFYFQPLLQKKFGLIKGVLIFGVLWEIWHLPLVLFYYSKSSMTLAQFILIHFINVTTTAIFIAYAYMRTHNIWLPVLIHFVNNNLSDFGVSNQKYTWIMVGIWFLIQIVIFFPFLFSKIFRKRITIE